MEKEVLKEDVDRFHRIMEYIEVGGNIIEDGEDPNADPNAQGGAPAGPTPDAGMPADPSMGGAPADPNAAPAPGADAGVEGPEGLDPQPDAAADPNAAPADPNAAPADPIMGGEQPGPDDNVLDVDDLTSAQEETNTAIQGLDAKFEQLVGTIDKFISAIDKNDAEIQNLKQELEKRNPTPLEKLDLRSVNDSFPYNVKPTDYWKDKEATSNYRVGGDDETPKQYELHQSDIDNDTDWKKISDSLDDEGILSDLNKIIGF